MTIHYQRRELLVPLALNFIQPIKFGHFWPFFYVVITFLIWILKFFFKMVTIGSFGDVDLESPL